MGVVLGRGCARAWPAVQIHGDLFGSVRIAMARFRPPSPPVAHAKRALPSSDSSHALFFTPVILWNVEHDWASFGFQVSDRSNRAPSHPLKSWENFCSCSSA